MRVHVVTLNEGDVKIEHAMFREWLMFSEHRYDLVLRYSPGNGFVRYRDGRLEQWHSQCGEFLTRPVSANRNRVVNEFLSDERADYLLMIDDDQMPQFNPLDYVECDFDVLGWPYPTCRNGSDNPAPWFPCEYEPGGGIVQSEVVGGGCLLVSRRVLEHPAMQGPFMFRYHDDGLLRLSEDYDFCVRAREAGFKIYVDLEHYVLHWKVAEMANLWNWAVHSAREEK